jgi:hypothetical protein
MKKLFIFAAAAAMLTACSSEELSSSQEVAQSGEGMPVAFSIYTPRTVTRAGLPQEITTASLQTGDHKDAGFGVFGYYTDGEDYVSANTFPNFMYNQQVLYSGGEWKYEPVKYWPNEYGNAATSDDVDRVSFFSYAPWVQVTPSTGVPIVKTLAFTGKWDEFIQSLDITWVKTTEDVVTADKAIYLKYLKQQGYTGKTTDAAIVAYVNRTYNENWTGTTALADAMTSVAAKNLKYISNVQTVTVATKADYKDYIELNGLATVTPAGDYSIAEAMLEELNKQQIQSKNISALSRNNATGDPIVKYAVDINPKTSVDLLWGVAAADYTSTWAPTTVTVTKDKPFIDLLKPNEPTGTAGASDSKVKFNLRHALAKLNVTVDYFDDATAPASAAGNIEADPVETKIFVREVHIGGFAMKGALNLNNQNTAMYTSTTPNTPIPNWKAYDGLNEIDNEDEVVWFKDGRRDGNEGAIGAVASNEKYLGLNPVIVQSSPYILDVDDQNRVIYNTAWSKVNLGVTKTAVNLFGYDKDGSNTLPIYVIPRNQEIDVKIVYDVETVNPKLDNTLSDGVTKGSSIENKISKLSNEVFGTITRMEAGKAYTIHLHLGMTSVKVDAVVEPWTTEEGTAVLPANQP